jgi:hypothetical protein
MIRLSAICLMLWPVQALAMNWEGHDDWWADPGPATELVEALPEAHPGPRRDCPVSHEAAEKNPYEQIPLPRHNCPPRPERAEPLR